MEHNFEKNFFDIFVNNNGTFSQNDYKKKRGNYLLTLFHLGTIVECPCLRVSLVFGKEFKMNCNFWPWRPTEIIPKKNFNVIWLHPVKIRVISWHIKKRKKNILRTLVHWLYLAYLWTKLGATILYYSKLDHNLLKFLSNGLSILYQIQLNLFCMGYLVQFSILRLFEWPWAPNLVQF